MTQGRKQIHSLMIGFAELQAACMRVRNGFFRPGQRAVIALRTVARFCEGRQPEVAYLFPHIMQSVWKSSPHSDLHL